MVTPSALMITIAEPSFLDGLKRSFELNLLLEDRYKIVIEGLMTSLSLSFLSFSIATILAIGLTYAILKSKILSRVVNAFSLVASALPMLVILLLANYVFFAGAKIPTFTVAVITFSVAFALNITKTFLQGIASVTSTEIEAARTMGFSVHRTFWLITYPKAWRFSSSDYFDTFVLLFKETSIVGYIAIVDLTRAGDYIRLQTFDAFFPIILVALIYFITTMVILRVFDYLLERLTARKEIVI